ncbi:hypothetical protein Bca4012_016328 [Brassica carinata]
MSKQEWTNLLPRLRTNLDADIGSILKFSYDALDDEDKYLFLHACFFSSEKIHKVEEHLAKKFLEVRQRLNILAEKSLISIDSGVITIHRLLQKLGREIVCKQSVHEPGLRQFLCDKRDICAVELPDLSTATNLEKLNLNDCSSLVKLPPAIGYTNNLEKLNLCNCSSLIKLPFWTRNATSPEKLDISGCSSLVDFPSFAGNGANLRELDISNCVNLVELPLSLGNLQKLWKLILRGCSKLEVLPTNINLESLNRLDLRDCSMLKCFPQISTNIGNLILRGTAIEQVPPLIRSRSRLDALKMSHFENLKDFPHALERITELWLSDTEIQEVPPWLEKISSLNHFSLNRCRKLNFANCFKLNQEARDLIIQNSEEAVLPGGQGHAYFTHRATGGGPLTIKLNEKPLPKSISLKACLLLLNKGDHDACFKAIRTVVSVVYKSRSQTLYLNKPLAQHLYTFRVEAEVSSSELLFEFKLSSNNVWTIGECRIVQHSESP